MNTKQLLAAVKRRHGITSDYGLAKFLQVTKQSASAYQSGTTLGDDVAVRVADALELDRAAVLAAMAMERAKSDDIRKAWRDALKRLGGLAAGVLMMIGGGPTPPPASAAPNAQCGVASGPLHIMLNRRRRRRARWLNPLRRLAHALAITPLVALSACAPFQHRTLTAGTADDCATVRAYGYAGNVDPTRATRCKP